MIQGFIHIRIMVCGLASLRSTYLFPATPLREDPDHVIFLKKVHFAKILGFWPSLNELVIDRQLPYCMRLNNDFSQVKILPARYSLSFTLRTIYSEVGTCPFFCFMAKLWATYFDVILLSLICSKIIVCMLLLLNDVSPLILS
jgi:hypothetical protein